MKYKIAIVRGPGLSKWEMQIYEPLTQWYHIVGIGSKKSVNDIRDIQFPVKQLACLSQYISFLPKVVPLMFATLGDTQWLYGFDNAVAGCDLIHSVELHNGYTYQAIAAKKKGKVRAVTLTVYENIPFLLDEFPARKKIKKEIIAYADHFLAANNKAREALLVEGAAEDKISLIPQSVDTHIFHPPDPTNAQALTKIRKQLAIDKNDFVVLGAGRMVWEKGWYDVVRAAYNIKIKYQSFDKLRTNIKNIRFLCIGEGPELNSLRIMIHKLGIEDMVMFVGAVPYQDMPHYFQLADMFVLPSIPTPNWNEQFGGVLIEAMASGLAVVGTLNGGIKDTIGDKGGFFVQPQDFSGLAYAIQKLQADLVLRKEMGKRNRKIAVRLYDTKIVAQKIKKIWDKHINSK